MRANEAPYMTKALRKAIASRSRLENTFHRMRTKESRELFKKQKNYCSRLYKKERKKFYNNLDPKCITDNKRFWNTMKPFFSDKGLNRRNITLIDGDDIISKDSDVANTLNTFFDNAVRTLEIDVPTECLNDVQGVSNPIQAAIQKYANHPSILKINGTIEKIKFSFNEIEISDIESEINNLNSKKANTFNCVPTKIIKEYRDVCKVPLFNIINNGIKDSMFDDGLKFADMTPVYKKGDVTDKRNYRPVSVLPVVSKLFERIIHKQIGSHIERYLSPYLCGYRKDFNAQHALLALLEK